MLKPMPERVQKYYTMWIKAGKLLGNPRDDQKFYWFVRVAVNDETINANEAWLRPYLERDLKEYPAEIKKQCDLFQLLADFLRSKLPD